MSLPKMMANLLADVGGLERRTGNSAYGPVYANAEEVKCSFQPGFQNITDRTGQEIVASAKVFTMPDVEVDCGDRFTIDSRQYEVVEVFKRRHTGIQHHNQVFLRSVK